ncbi:hypothetical protein BU25DRAFT_414891 [Macroventuria anomochaeta]|uniref:Uncharacterized protein n=1 Tax=Macroventuria anomochaeta TaxID=301207 RepID=A0ACB6RP27_9PLEO|nr:uncharacterized protein BU25DRAFT_414891 [Macroventuria anomochaeta]KAF2622904.1 hypothetical protein BU25DRAFT_414891 [Macroventuria anomochaeta]
MRCAELSGLDVSTNANCPYEHSASTTPQLSAENRLYRRLCNVIAVCSTHICISCKNAPDPPYMCQDLKLSKPFLLNSRTTIEWLDPTNRRFLLVSIPSSDPKCHLLHPGTPFRLFQRWFNQLARVISGSRYGPIAPASLIRPRSVLASWLRFVQIGLTILWSHES